MKFPIKRILIILFFTYLANISFSLSSNQSQNITQELQHEVTVTLKLIQVFVTDGKGNPVTDLEQYDFILYDNSKLKTITDFEKHFLIKHEKKIEEKLKETELPPARKISTRMNRKFFLLLDMFQNDMVGMKKSKKAALHFIDTQVQPTDEVCVLSYSQDRGLILHEYLTTDFQKVLEAIKRVKGVPGRMIKRNRDWVKVKTRQYATELQEFAKSLRYIPGFKNIILFSAGISRSLFYDEVEPDSADSIMGMTKKDPGVRVIYEDMCKELASSNSPVYTVNTKGARGLLDDLRADIETERGSKGDHSLQMLSDLSGGKYFADVEHYEKISEEIQNVTGNYYVLGYYIDEKWDGKYHEIKVKVKRKGCQVYAQGGYFNPKPFTEFSEFEKQLHLFDLALSEKPYFQEQPLYFSSIALPCSEKKESNIVLLSEITVDKIEEVVKGKTEVITLVFNKDNSIVESRRAEIHFSTIPEKTIYHYTIASLNPGEYECRVVIRNLKTGKGAVGSSSVVIAEPLDSGIKLYPPLLLIPDRKAYYLKFSRDQKDKSESESLSLNNIYPFLSNKHSPLVEGVDRGTNRVWAVVRCSFLGIQQPDIKLSANLIHHLADTEKKIPVTISILNRYQEDDTEIFLIELQTKELQSGEYSLYLFAEDRLTQSRSDVHTTFKVK